jgi:hypothetical protein
MLEYMIKKGLTPTASTFSALIHSAVKQGEKDMVTSLVDRAKQLGLGELTPKGLATLVQANFLSDSEFDPAEKPRTPQQVELVLTLIETVMQYPSDLTRRFDHGKDH